jgi:chromosome segregation ATPase
MMKAENGRIGELDAEIAALTQELAAAKAEHAELDSEREAAQELGRDVDARLHALLMERRGAEDEYKKKLAQIQMTSSR